LTTTKRPAAIREAAEQGRAARSRLPRGQLGEWDPAVRPRPALAVLRGQEADRDPKLLPLRYQRMSESPWTYLRGAAAVMAEDLAQTPNTGLMVQVCGDAHVLNFGLWASPERNLTFDLRDFDETLPGPFEFDCKRLAASLIVCAEQNGLPVAVGDAAVAEAMASYRQHMTLYAAAPELDVWYDRIDVEVPLAALAKPARRSVRAEIDRQALRRTNAGAFRKLTAVVDGRRVITEAPPVRVRLPDQTQRDPQEVAQEVYDSYLASVPPHLSYLLSRFTFTDAVQQVVGVGSVGMRVILVLMEGRGGQAPLFLQIKQATSSVYERYVGPSKYGNHGQRVVVGQRLLQSATDMFAGWTSVDGLDFYVRQFRDMKIIPDGPAISGFLPQFAESCGHALAKSHARSGDAVAIAAYIGKGQKFDAAMGAFAHSYANQTVEDHADLVAAIKAEQVPVS
jgi:uncharacterized protein (DUF2252 family)